MYHRKLQEFNEREHQAYVSRLNAYNADPNTCSQCHAAILCPTAQKLGEVKKKRFCDRSCAAAYNNTMSPKRTKSAPKSSCAQCGLSLRSDQVRCGNCWKDQLALRTKEELAPPHIRVHARNVMKPKGKPCQRCGYSVFVEVCHIRPVSSFSSGAVMAEINHPNNLVLLCPNCHWELDHGLLAMPASVPIGDA